MFLRLLLYCRSSARVRRYLEVRTNIRDVGPFAAETTYVDNEQRGHLFICSLQHPPAPFLNFKLPVGTPSTSKGERRARSVEKMLWHF